jgi:hypothetical protein
VVRLLLVGVAVIGVRLVALFGGDSMKQFSLSDFSGGISENFAYDAFTDDAMAKAYGFILDGTVGLRTQWAVEQLGTDQFSSIRGFDARVNSYLVGIKSSGSIWFTVLPDDSVELAGSLSWTQVTQGTLLARQAERGTYDSVTGTIVESDDVVANTERPTDTVVSVVDDPRYRFICEVPADQAKHTQTVSASGEVTAQSDIVLYAGSGLLINACYDDAGVRPSQALILREVEVSAGVFSLEAVVFGSATAAHDIDRYPELKLHPTLSNQTTPRDGVMPHGNVGTMWGDRLFLADVFWWDGESPAEDTDVTVDDSGTPDDTSDDVTTITYTIATMRPTLSTAGGYGTTRRYRNAIWVSDPGFPYVFDPLSLDLVVSEDCEIVDLQVIDTGLLVYTTSVAGQSGLILLSGTAGSYKVEELRNVGALPASSDVHRSAGTFWQASGSFVVVDKLGGIWATNGDAVYRLDGPASVDLQKGCVQSDHAASLGQYLFVSHSGRLLCMRAFGKTAGWTELALPLSSAVEHMTVAGNSLYFLQSGYAYRLGCNREDGHGDMPVGSSAEFSFGSQTVAIPDDDGGVFSRSQWHRVGLVLSSVEGTGTLVDVSVSDAPALASGNVFTTALSESVSSRSKHVVAGGLGFIDEGSVSFTVSGDVAVESLSVWFSPGRRVL